VNTPPLTKNEKTVLLGITKYPTINDRELSDILDVKLSTLTSIKRRLASQGYYRSLMVPHVNRLGCELLAIIYMQYNPIIPLTQRLTTTKRTIEIFDELFLSIGEAEKGFSVSVSQNYTNIGRINEIRTETFGMLGLLEKEYPHEVIFPFETSTVHRFFDFASVLQQLFSLDETHEPSRTTPMFQGIDTLELSVKEKKVLSTLIEHPIETTEQIGNRVGLSRHTIARMKNRFFEEGLLHRLTLPNLKMLGIEILTFYHICFNPNKAPRSTELAFLNSTSTVFFVSRKFEAVLLSAYPTYQEYKDDEMRKIRYLKENTLLSQPPFISPYMVEHMVLIKDFDFVSIVRKIFKDDV
jgi:DNA-binding MarR family transcriptional regulator